MKRFILIIISLIFLSIMFQNVSAQVMKQLNVSIDVHDDASDVEIAFRFTEEIKEIEIPFPGKITVLETEFGKCEVRKEWTEILHCEPPSPFMVGEVTIKTKLKAEGLTETRENITKFSLDIPLAWKTEKVRVEVKLPENTALAEGKLISPSGVDTRLIGRRVVARWYIKDKDVGDVIPIRIFYESLGQPGFITIIPRYLYHLIGILIIVVVVGFIVIYKKVARRAEVILSVLNENERKIIDIIKEEGRVDVDQRKIVAKSGFSKAKVSRLIRSLESRGIVQIERIGRKNRVSLKKIELGEE